MNNYDFCGDTTAAHIARMHVGEKAGHPVKIIPGDSEPRYEGSGFYWETKGGTIIRHPSAYSKYGWSNMIYVSSDLHITVGEEWLKGLRVRHHKVDGVTMYIKCGSRETIHGITVSNGWCAGGRYSLVENGLGQTYHAGSWNKRYAVRTAIRAWTRQSRELRKFSSGLGVDLNLIEVTKEDSYAAGNCKPGTENFMLSNGLFGKESIKATELLDLAKNGFNISLVKATISAAARRIQDNV
jgi:hypothetical protein